MQPHVNPILSSFLKRIVQQDGFQLVSYTVSYESVMRGVKVSISLKVLKPNGNTDTIRFKHAPGFIEFNVTGSDTLYRSPNIGALQYNSNFKSALYNTVYLHQDKTGKRTSRFTQKM